MPFPIPVVSSGTLSHHPSHLIGPVPIPILSPIQCPSPLLLSTHDAYSVSSSHWHSRVPPLSPLCYLISVWLWIIACLYQFVYNGNHKVFHFYQLELNKAGKGKVIYQITECGYSDTIYKSQKQKIDEKLQKVLHIYFYFISQIFENAGMNTPGYLNQLSLAMPVRFNDLIQIIVQNIEGYQTKTFYFVILFFQHVRVLLPINK